MEIKVENKFNKENKISKKKTVNNTGKSTFQKILDKSRKDSLTTEKELVKEKIDKIIKVIQTYEAKDISKILDINICSGDEKFFKKNGAVDIREIIIRYGDKMSDKDLDKFEADVTNLWKDGYIDDDDYAYAMKWIIERKQGKMVLSTIKKTENDGIDNIVTGNN